MIVGLISLVVADAGYGADGVGIHVVGYGQGECHGAHLVVRQPGLAREFTRVCQGYPELREIGHCLADRHGGFDLDCPDCWYFVDLRQADLGVADEIAKYVTKGSQVVKAGPRAVLDYLFSMKGKRLVQTFGNLYGVDLEADDEPSETPLRDGECPWEDCPYPGLHEWEHVVMGYPDGFSLEYNPNTGTSRVVLDHGPP